jgi:uncharacterized membrane protein
VTRSLTDSWRDDRGSVMLLGLGAIGVCLLAVVTGIDASAAFLQRRALVALADAAALAGAQALDEDAYYRQGASAATTLSPDGVRVRVREFLARPQLSDIEGLVLDEVTSDGHNVMVSVSAPLSLPFLGSLATEPVRVQSHARLAYRPAG